MKEAYPKKISIWECISFVLIVETIGFSDGSVKNWNFFPIYDDLIQLIRFLPSFNLQDHGSCPR